MPPQEVLERIHEALRTEYECRRRVMVTRFAVTLQSFQWAERAKVRGCGGGALGLGPILQGGRVPEMVLPPQEHGAALPDVLTSLRRAGAEPSAVTLARLLAVRADASRLVPASAGAARLRTCCSVNKVPAAPAPGGPPPVWIEPRRPGSWILAPRHCPRSSPQVLMGSVPDRGGRPSELEAPMPSWEPRRQGGGGGARWGRKGKKKK